MARAAVVLALAVCCLLAATAPARRPVDLPPARLLPDAVVLADREAAAEPLRPKPAGDAPADCAEAGDERHALAVPEEDPARDEGPRQRASSLLCLVFRCGGEPAAASSGHGALVEARPSSGSEDEEPTTVEGGAWPAVSGKAELEDGEDRPYDTDSDYDCDSDSDDEDEGGIFGWLWRLADRF